MKIVGKSRRGAVENSAGKKIATIVSDKVSDIAWKINNKVIASSDLYQKMILNGYADHAVAGLFKDAKCTYYSKDVIENIFKSDNVSDVIDTLSECSNDVISALNSSNDKKAAIQIINNYGDNGLTALKNGITPEQIIEIESFGITPNGYYGGKDSFEMVRNLKILSKEDAQKIIDSNHKIHSLFSDEQLKGLKENVLAEEDKVKADFKAHKIAGKFNPAVAGVGYKNPANPDAPLEMFYGINNNDGDIPSILDSKEEDPPSELLKDLKKRITNMPQKVYDAYKEFSKAPGSHAEVYAVCEALVAHPEASIEDFVVYVNYDKPFNKSATGHSFYTCPHCKYILEQFNILSNVEVYK